MKICVVVPSVEYMAQAGVRIRYRRIVPYLKALGHQLLIEPIDEFRSPAHRACDLYLFSKCYDARAIVLARLMRAAGKLTGADFFDDMFSHDDDSRFVRHRAWAREMAQTIDFALASTPRMKAVMAELMPGVPIHVLNDPFDAFDGDRIGDRIESKRKRALASRRLPIAWFGVGDNPHFPVGLNDLSAFGEDLLRFVARGYAVDLRILTNKRALNEEGLRMIARLPVPHTIQEWTQAGEIDLLDRSLISFIPVNGQNFSIAKSLNRAVSALTGGTQILSSGYPLYAPLAEFLYRDPDVLVDDIERGRLNLRTGTIPALEEAFEQWGNPTIEVEKLAGFLTALAPPDGDPDARVAVLHGRRSQVTVHKLAQRLGQLSVGTPFAPAELNYDVRVRPAQTAAEVAIEVSARGAARLDPAVAALSIAPENDESGARVFKLRAPAAAVDRLAISGSAGSIGLAAALAGYDAVMNDVAAMLARIYPGIAQIVSETEAPLDTVLRAANDSADDRGRGFELIDSRPVERILFVANAQVPSLHISFIKPLEPCVEAGRLRILTITDEDLKALYAKKISGAESRQWVADQLTEFAPTLVIFCRYSGPLLDVYRGYCAAHAVPMVFHVDDDLLNIPREIGEKKWAYHNAPARIEAVRTLMRSADLVYASTEELRQRVAETGLARKLVSGRIYCSSEIRREPVPRPVRKFGYMGGGDHAPDLETVLPAIAAILDRHPQVEFEIFGAIPLPEPLERFGNRVRVIPPIPVYAEFLKAFSEMDWDIGICPLVRSPFNAAKANTKWIEYTAVGIAVVATSGMAYDDCCAGGAGMLADGVDQWIDALDRLIGEDGLCYAQTMIAQAKLRQDYSLRALQHQIFDIVEPVIGRPLVAGAR